MPTIPDYSIIIITFAITQTNEILAKENEQHAHYKTVQTYLANKNQIRFNRKQKYEICRTCYAHIKQWRTWINFLS